MQSPAKINLFLKITGTRPDGYHDIEILFLPLRQLHDELEVTWTPTPGRGSSVSLSTNSAEIPCDDRNLCCKAAKLFMENTGLTGEVSIHLDKIIPVAAGLGGGSSNAATTLLALNQATGEPLSHHQLVELATALGADVPFFLNPVPAVAHGIGEILEPITVAQPCGIILFNPGFPISAAWAYKNWQPNTTERVPRLEELRQSLAFPHANLAEIAKCCFNDLEKSAFAKFPLLQLLRLKFLAAGCLCCHISGSGPTLFGLTPASELDAIAAKLKPAIEELSITNGRFFTLNFLV